MIETREDARRLISELKKKGRAFNKWFNSLKYDTIMHMTNEKMQKCRGAWDEGYERGKEYEAD